MPIKIRDNPLNEVMDATTNVDNPAAGPDTANCDPLINATIIPPIIPDNNPAYKGDLR